MKFSYIAKTKRKFAIPFFRRVSLLDKVFFIKHLSLMIKAGLTIREAVAVIQEQTKSKRFKKILDDILKNLDNGQTLAKSLARHPKVFSPLYINIVKIGETSGTLEENLKYLSSQLEKSHALKRKIKAAMIYPIIVLVATFGLAGGLSIFVFPKLIPLFRSFDIELPLPTKILLWIVETIQNYGFYVFEGLVVFIIVLIFVSRLRSVKSFNHKLLLKLPIAGAISRNVNLAYFARTLATLCKSGVAIVEALDITSSSLANITYQNQLKKLSLKVQRGEAITAYLKKQPKLFPPTFSQMIRVGEKTGSLDESLFYLAEFYETEVDNRTKNLSSVLEPVLLIIIGIVVAFIGISIITPIYQLTSGLRG